MKSKLTRPLALCAALTLAVGLTAVPMLAANGSGAPQQAQITRSQAKAAALDHAALTEEDLLFCRTKLDREDGRLIYEVELLTGTAEYEYEIDAASGAVLSLDCQVQPFSSQADDRLDETRIKAIVEKKAGASGVYTEFELETDDGRLIYEGEMRCGQWEYEFEVDALSGTILDWDMDRD